MSDRRSHKFVDMQIPLAWLIGSFAVIAVAIGGVLTKIDTISESVAKLETKLDVRDESITRIKESIAKLEARSDSQQLQIERNGNRIEKIELTLVSKNNGANR